ncbi:MAG: alpha/beta hydrolase [Methanobrevibacter sp.]|jgi:acetyl esterase/lipase|nr:alpha/beta hydrolase [Candidatus Methanoflexus mossambicus]
MNEIKVKRDISYGNDTKNKLDIYFPRNENVNDAAIIDIHGGGWWQGDKAKEELMARRFVDDGYLVFVPNYRLADGNLKQNLYPTPVEDIERVVDFALDSNYNFNQKKLGVFGSSSGGNLAVEMATRRGLPTVSWSGLLDFEGFFKAHPNIKSKKRVAIGKNQLSSEIDQDGADDAYYAWCIENYLGFDINRKDLHEATVLNRFNENTGSLFLINSNNEFVPENEIEVAEAIMIANNRPVKKLVVEGSRHGEAYTDVAWEPTKMWFAKTLEI